ncbi:MAG: SGNH/GDSL hydrolase family protein [Sedimentisphaerales bacterium]|nr:SGNH/GDSL hydrolase family protein [Sedimentisphaerales bacterium]
MIIAGLISNPWLIRFFFPSFVGETMALKNQILLILGEIVLLFFGVSWFRANTPTKVRYIYFKAISIGLVIVCIELFLQLFLSLIQPPRPDWRLSVPQYRDKQWAAQFFSEVSQSNHQTEFAQHVGWIRRNFHGTYINIDSQGARKTWNQSDRPTNQDKIVFMFGGSTMFGLGARDDRTIASDFSRLLNEKQQESYFVYNFGQPAYIFFQELIKLIVLLHDGYRPHYVLFYNGANEIYGSYQSGKAGVYLNFEQIRHKVEDEPSSAVGYFYRGFTRTIDSSKIYQAIDRLSQQFERNSLREKAVRYSDQQLRILAMEVADDYGKSIQLLQKLSESYGFEYICFMQPLLCLEEEPIEDISLLGDPSRIQDPAFRKLHHYVYEEMRTRKFDRVVDISDTLQNRTTPIFYDFCHISEEGEALVAERLYKEFVSRTLTQ